MNWLNSTAYHLIVFLASLLSFTVLIATGHEGSKLVEGIFYGILGTSGVNSSTSLLQFFRGPDAPDIGLSGGSGKQQGRSTVHFLMWLVVSIVTVLMVACGTVGTASATQQVAIACASGSASVKALTVAQNAHALSAADTKAVDDALAIVTPLCTGVAPPTVTDAEVTALTAAFNTLAGLQAKYHAAPPGQ